MADEIDTGVCVGGPWDGKMHCTARARTDFVVQEVEKGLMIAGLETPLIVKVRRTIYRRELFRTETKDFLIWVPEGQSVEDTMQKLLTSYVDSASTRNKP